MYFTLMRHFRFDIDQPCIDCIVIVHVFLRGSGLVAEHLVQYALLYAIYGIVISILFCMALFIFPNHLIPVFVSGILIDQTEKVYFGVAGQKVVINNLNCRWFSYSKLV